MNPVSLRRILLDLALALSLIVLFWSCFGDGSLRFGRSTATTYRDIRLAEASEVIIPIAPGEFFTQVMGKAGLELGETVRLIKEVRPVYDLARIQSGQAFTLYFRGKWLRNFFYPIDAGRYLEVARAGKGNFSGRIRDFPYQVRREMVKMTISGSLYDAALAAAEKAELVERIAAMFEYDVDFNRDIRPGDALSVIVEKKYLAGELAAYGDILAAELVSGGKTIQIVHFVSPDGSNGYYYPDGRSTRKMFLRSPLPFIRVSSSFGMRFHPILGFSARHNGIDLRAPIGTPVRATASGVITSHGFESNRGRFVILRHPNSYVSQYFHLSRFRAEIRTLMRVEQGEIIGYVGSTGLSTGPHLHYGMLKDGRYMNPLSPPSSRENPLKKEYLTDFFRRCRELTEGFRSFRLSTAGVGGSTLWPVDSRGNSAAAAGLSGKIGHD